MGRTIYNHISNKGLVCRKQSILTTQYEKTHDPLKTQAKNLNKHFAKEDTQTASKYMKRCSISLDMREMQIRTRRCHFTPIKMATKRWRASAGKNVEKLKPSNYIPWQECKMVQPPWKTFLQFLKTLEIELTFHPTILLLGIHSREMKTDPHKNVNRKYSQQH